MIERDLILKLLILTLVIGVVLGKLILNLVGIAWFLPYIFCWICLVILFIYIRLEIKLQVHKLSQKKKDNLWGE